jgi:hypothetical protein
MTARFLVLKVTGDKLQTLGPVALITSEDEADAEARRLCAASRAEAYVVAEVVADYTWEPTVMVRKVRTV